MENAKSKDLTVKQFSPVPRKMADWVRKTEFHRTINDLVEEIHLVLVMSSDDTYRKFLDAVYDEQAIEGSLAADNIEAARLIRDEAKKRNVIRIADSKLATIVKALNIALRRYGESRNERRNRIGGEIIETD